MERIERENRVVVDAWKSPEEGAYATLDLVKKALGEGGPSAERLNPPSGAAGGSEISVVTEEGLSGGVTKASCEMLAKASELAAKVGGYVTAIYGGGEKPEELVARGADRVVLLQVADPRDYMAHADALMRLVTERRPWAVLAPSTSYGRDVLARAAARLGLGLAADCVDLDVVGGRLAQFKPAFGGAVVSVIYSKTTPYMATARPGTFPPYSLDYGRRGEVIEMRIEPWLRFAAREAARWEPPDPRETVQPPNEDQAGDFKRRRGALAGGAPQVAAPHLRHDRPRVSRRPAYLLDDGNLRDRRGRSREAIRAPPHDEEGRYSRLTPTQPPGGQMTHIGRVEFVARVCRRRYPRRQRSTARHCDRAR